jgi:hypothetical protein
MTDSDRLAPRVPGALRRLGWAVTLIVSLAAVGVTASTATTGSGGRSAITPELAAPPGFALGVTHTMDSADAGGVPAAVAKAKSVLAASVTFQNQHVMGWGALNPNPSPGVYDWSSLDRRMNLIRSSGGTPVITLCCAPDWMKGGASGATDWSRLEVAPTPDHYGDFADLAAAVALRYPDVRYFQVWNELKGFWNESENRWDYEGYTALYNEVYDRLKAVSPAVQVGGPYVVVDSGSDRDALSYPSDVGGSWGVLDQRPLDVLRYWLVHAHGADFVSVDTAVRDIDAARVDPVPAGEKLTAVARWVRGLTSLPLWFSEFYVMDPQTSRNDQRAAALVALAQLRMIEGGADVSLLWEPQQGPGAAFPGLFTDTRSPGGGRALPLAAAYRELARAFPGASAASVSWPMPAVGQLRGSAADVFVNASADPATILSDGVRTLRPWQVVAVPHR